MSKWDNLQIMPDQEALVRYAAERIIRIASATLEINERFSMALAGGSTPRPVYELLGTEFGGLLDWRRIHLFWGDERCVPPDDVQSNYRMFRESLLQHIDIPETNVHRIHGEDDPQAVASAYEAELRAFFVGDDTLFDFNLLGMGDDGHTASLFPGTKAIHEEERWVVAHHVEKLAMSRLTLTPAAILKSANIMFLISGAGKAAAFREVLQGEMNPDTYPAQVIARSGHPHLVWAVDAAAAAQLDGVL